MVFHIITIHHELDIITMCKTFLDTVIVTCFYHDINDALKYCPTLIYKGLTSTGMCPCLE